MLKCLMHFILNERLILKNSKTSWLIRCVVPSVTIAMLKHCAVP